MTAPRRAVRVLLRPIQAFVQTEASSGIVLLAATAAALAWANSPWDGSYGDLWGTDLSVSTDLISVHLDLLHLINDGLMAVFFFVVGLEIKRELLHGELASRQRAALPVAAALGGMVAPALIYTAANAGGDGAHGWGIPMATDVAFSLGVLAILGRRAPFALKVFLLGLAIVDDLGAIAVIAVFYSDSVSLGALGWAIGLLAAVFVCLRLGVRGGFVYVVLGLLTWLAVFKSGVHATVAGVALAALVPSGPKANGEELVLEVETMPERPRATELATEATGVEPPLDRLERALHPWVSYLIVPLFALANTGVSVSGGTVGDAARSAVTGGVLLGLAVGKPLGIFAFSWLAVRTRLAELPPTLGFVHVLGVGLLGGIGFTVSLFVTGLAFDGPSLIADAKLGILGASALSAAVGFAYLWFAPGEREVREAAGAGQARRGASAPER